MDTGAAVTSASSFLAERSDAMVILVAMIALAAFWLWKIHLPRIEHQKKIYESQQDILRTSARTLDELCKSTQGIDTTTRTNASTLHAILAIKEIELDCIAKVCEKTQCDLREPIAEARGVLRAVRAGATE